MAKAVSRRADFTVAYIAIYFITAWAASPLAESRPFLCAISHFGDNTYLRQRRWPLHVIAMRIARWRKAVYGRWHDNDARMKSAALIWRGRHRI